MLLELSGGGAQLLLTSVADRHVRAYLREAVPEAEVDAAATPGDEQARGRVSDLV
jgi:hypothetical protein